MNSLLAARDLRQEKLALVLGEGGQSIAFLSLNLPGQDKTPPAAATLFGWALAAIARAFPGARWHVRTQDALGHYAIATIDAAPRTVKGFAIALENRHAAARLIDLDVYAPDGTQLGRRELGLPPRPCLVCDAAAVDCIRLQRHERQHVIARAQALLLESAQEDNQQGETIAVHLLSGKTASENRTSPGDLPEYPGAFPFSAHALRQLAACLCQGAREELALTPKPGLVDRLNNGSHPDLSFALMEASLDIVAAYLEATASSLLAGEPFACQKQLAIAAEQQLYAQLHTNTHKGFIFLSGMLLIACWQARTTAEAAIRRSLSSLAAGFFRDAPLQPTHGQRAREKYRAGGIVEETLRGFPALFEAALPAYRMARVHHGDEETVRFALLARLMQCVEDTTTLHRAGPSGLASIRQDGRRLEEIIAQGGNFRAYLEQRDREYIRQNLTMGGVADMLGMALGYQAWCDAALPLRSSVAHAPAFRRPEAVGLSGAG